MVKRSIIKNGVIMNRKCTLIFSVTVILMIFISFGCKKNDNPVDSGSFTGNAQDYFPSTANQQIDAVVSGTVTYYDSLNGVTSMQEITNQDVKCYLGSLTVFRGLNAIPVFGYDNNGNENLAGYFANSNGDIVATDKNPNSYIATILPKQLTINDEWIINSQSSLNRQTHVKLVEALEKYTNSAGNSYSNVIHLYVSYNDSTGYYYSYGSGSYYSGYETQNGICNVYLAKGIGLVDIKLNNFTDISKWVYVSSGYNYSGYTKESVNGSVGRK